MLLQLQNFISFAELKLLVPSKFKKLKSLAALSQQFSSLHAIISSKLSSSPKLIVDTDKIGPLRTKIFVI